MSETIGQIDPPYEPEPDPSLAYAPYGQLVKMLLPRSTGVAIYNHAGELVWCSGGYEKPEYQQLAGRTLAATQRNAEIGAIVTTKAGHPAFCAQLHSCDRALGCVIVELGATRDVWNQTVIAGLLTPVVRCLEGSMSLEQSRPVANGTGSADKGALDLLLEVDEDNPDGPSPLHRLLQHSVEHLDGAVGAIVITDKNIIVACDAAGNTTLASSELLNRTQRNLLAWAQLNNRPMLVNHVVPDSETLAYKILSCPVRGENDRVIGVVALFRHAAQEDFDLRDVRILEFIARRVVGILQSRHDALTGLLHRPLFERRVQAQLMGHEGERNHAVLYIDIDHLQRINETFGCHAGDEVIQRLGEAVHTVLRPVDMASRYGGDRFVIYLHDLAPDDVSKTADVLRAKMSQLRYLQHERIIDVSASIGIVFVDGAPRKLTHVLAAAELACKQAKAQGRNRIVVAAPSAQQIAQEQSALYVSVNLRHALANNEFRLEAQPIFGIAISPGEIMGHEILLRLRDSDGQLMAPDKFFDAAGRYGLMPAIDRWTIATCAHALQEAGISYTHPANQITFNVSAQSLLTEGFAEFVLEELLRARLPAPAFRFDIKETVAIRHPDAVRLFIRKIRDAGAQVGLDDFGSGTASFAGLKNIPIQYLKIDGRLIRRVTIDKAAEQTIRGIVKAAEIFGAFTIAEHVESAEILARLEQLEVNFGQGFHLGRPRPLDEIIA